MTPFHGGCLADEPDARDEMYPASQLVGFSGSSSSRPKSFDWLAHVKEIYHQGRTNSCVGHAIVGAAGAHARVAGYDVADGCPWGTYTLGRMSTAGMTGQLTDTGAQPRRTFKALQGFGVPAVGSWPPKEMPPALWINQRIDNNWESLASGADHRISQYFWVDDAPGDRTDMINELEANGNFVCMAIQNDRSLQECRNMTPIPAPADDDTKGGLHYVYCVGYHNGNPMIVNSWGKDWGQGGIALLSRERIAHRTTQSIVAIGVDVF